MNIKYSRFYNGTEKTPFYGNGAGKKDTVVKQEFNTTNQRGSSIQAAKDVRPQYGDSVAVEFSKDGIEALVEGRKGSLLPDDQGTMQTAKAKNEAFQKEIQQIDNTLNDLPAYSGLYGADKAVAAALEFSDRKQRLHDARREAGKYFARHEESRICSRKYDLRRQQGVISKRNGKYRKTGERRKSRQQWNYGLWGCQREVSGAWQRPCADYGYS